MSNWLIVFIQTAAVATVLVLSSYSASYVNGCPGFVWLLGLKVALTDWEPTYYPCRSDNQTITNYTTYYDDYDNLSSFLHFNFAEIRALVQYNLLRNVTHFLENLLRCVVLSYLPSFLPTCALIVGYCVNFIKLVKSCYIS